MDRVQRRVIANLLSHYNTNLVGISHELYRISHIHGSGLTEKEILYVRKREAQLQELIGDLHVIADRCNHSAGL